MARRAPRVVLLSAALAASCSSEAPSEATSSGDTAAASEPAAVTGSAATPSEVPTPPPAPPPPPPPPSFAEQVAGLVGDAEPSAESSKRAWAHYKAKAYGDAQKEFALAALHEPQAWKPAFNLACASALADDEAMVRIALTEARARDPGVVPDKARSDGDLAAFRSKPWFEEVLAGPPEPADDPNAGLSNGTMYFALDTGTTQAIASLDDLGEFAVHLADGRSIEVAPDGREYVLRSKFELAPAEEGSAPLTKADMGRAYHFDLLAGGEVWAVNPARVGHYLPASETWSTRALDPPAETLRGIEVDASGTVWIATTDKLYAYSADYEAIVELPAPVSPNVELLQGADGGLYLHRAADVLRLQDGEWTRAGALAPPPGGRIERVIALADGSLVGFTLPDHQLVRVGKDGTTARLRLDDETQVLALAVDAGKRVWASTPLGLFVIDPEFRGIMRRYGVGSIDAFILKGKVADVVQIVAVGGALALPESEAPRHVISGRLVHAGKPLANTPFEMCDNPARNAKELRAKGSLCGVSDEDREMRELDEMLFRREYEPVEVLFGTTDGEGRFRVTHVVDYAYDFAAIVDGKVRASRDWVCCEHRPFEGVYRMGDVELR